MKNVRIKVIQNQFVPLWAKAGINYSYIHFINQIDYEEL